jgi:hypothetical protein
MESESRNESRVYHAGINQLVLIGILTLFFVALGIYNVAKSHDWSPLCVCLVAMTALFALQLVLRMEIGPTGFKYRNLSGAREIKYADVNRAYFDVIHASNAPQGVAAFFVERRDGTRVKINIRTFSVRAAADLFTKLESHGIQIEVPDAWAARRTVQQVRAAQAKFKESRSHV